MTNARHNFATGQSTSKSSPAAEITQQSLHSLDQLLAFPDADADRLDIALMNLLCAEGLPGAMGLSIGQCLATLHHWAACMRRYTRDGRNDYRDHPKFYQNHEGVFCFAAMVTLLKHPRGLGIKYCPSAVGSYNFADSRDDLLHGVLTRRLGTCTSLPVLFVAIGRRLGYPMHLAIAKGHVLCQWVDARGKINLEGSCAGGGDALGDEHYRRWPRPLTNQDMASNRYLRPLTPNEELALFLETRGHCLVDNQRFDEAREAYEHAYRLAPQWSPYAGHLWSATLHEKQARSVTRSPQGSVPDLSECSATPPAYPHANIPSNGLAARSDRMHKQKELLHVV